MRRCRCSVVTEANVRVSQGEAGDFLRLKALLIKAAEAAALEPRCLARCERETVRWNLRVKIEYFFSQKLWLGNINVYGVR